MSTQAIVDLDPKPVWRFFADMAAVPRPSKKEERIRAHLKDVAARHGLTVREDGVGNLVIAVPATAGHEQAQTVVLQGHVDMVCEKNADTEHDFDNEGIKLILATDDESGEPIVRADGTTLGADNGIGLAMALAAATSDDVVHGPLEILCTIDEEMGMTGAGALEPGFFTGTTFINLDSEEDDVIYIGCAGGGDNTLAFDLPTQPIHRGARVVRINIRGLRGGHSGGDIHENRGNANKVLVRLLQDVLDEDLQLVTIAGGSKRNAIAREAHAVIAMSDETLARVKSNVDIVRNAIMHEAREPNIAIDVEAVGNASAALSTEDTRRVLATLLALPHGVLEMHPTVKGLVQTSNNVATVVAESLADRLRIVIGTLARSSVDARLDQTRVQVDAIGRLAGATVEYGNAYPGWAPNPESDLVKRCARVYEGLFGEPPNVTAIHAGLECGIIGKRMGGGLDMVSFGPRITGAHSPDEQTYVNSVQKSYDYLTAVLAELA